MSESYDLVVIGGGLAGTVAAISAARMGAQVALIQDRPVLGGNSSSEIRVRLAGAGAEAFMSEAPNGIGNIPWVRETGIIEEIFSENRSRDPSTMEQTEIGSTWDLVLYEKVKSEENISLFLNTHATDVKTSGDSVAEVTCVQMGSEKRLSFKGRIFLDATGDGTIAALGGAEFRMGREGRDEFGEACAPEEADDLTMGSTLQFHAKDMGHPVEFKRPLWAAQFPSENDLPFRSHGHFSQGFWWIEVGNPPYNTIDDNETIRDELLKNLLGVWDHIKNHGDHGAENYALDWIGMVPGKRESRRIVGDYTLNEKDLKSSRIFPDAVAYGGWFMDRHTPGGILSKYDPPEPCHGENAEIMKDAMVPGPYSIPLRSLYSKNVKNLMMAGRDISATHVAFASTRQMATCAVIGQAAGAAAYLCAKYDALPSDISENHIEELQQSLLKQDCYIPMAENRDEADRARSAKTITSSDAPLDFAEGAQTDELYSMRTRIKWGLNEPQKGNELDAPLAQLFPVSEDRLDSVSIFLESRRSDDVRLSLGLRQADTIWDFSATADIAMADAEVPAGSAGWVRFQLNQPVDPQKLYWIHLSTEKDIFWQRCPNHPIGTVSAFQFLDVWKAQKHVYNMSIEPVSRPYGGDNVVSGTIRPERWTNVWISDPGEVFPQWLEIELGGAVKFNRIYLTFDTGLNASFFYIPPFHRAPECVRDYEVVCLSGKEWKSLVRVEGNYERRRVHSFPEVESSKVRVTVHATNGAQSAIIYEARLYNEP